MPSRRWRSHSNRHTVAAAARFSDSARAAIGTRTVASASDAISVGSPQASFPNTKATGSGQVGLVEVAPRRRASIARTRTPRARSASIAAGVLDASDDRQVEERARGRADGLRVVDVDRRRGEHDAVGTRGVGRAQDRPRVAGIADRVQERDAGGRRRQRFERHVEERRDADEALRASPCDGEPAHHVVAHVERARRPTPTRRSTSGCAGPCGTASSRPPARSSASATGLAPSTRNAPIAFAEGSLLQPDRGGDLRVPNRRDHAGPSPVTPLRSSATGRA